MHITMKVPLLLIILLLTSGLSVNAELNTLEKEIAVLKIKINKQDAELRQLKNITDTQAGKIDTLNKLNDELNESLQQKIRNHSAMIDDLQNSKIDQQEQLENLTRLARKCLQNSLELDGSGLSLEIYELFNISTDQQKQIEYLMDQRKNDTKLQQMLQVEINAVDMKFLNITDNQYNQIKNLTKQNENLQNVVQLDQNNSNNLISSLSKNQKRLTSIIEDGAKCIWQRPDDGIFFRKLAIHNGNFVRLELMSAKGYLGCPYDICDFRTCPISFHDDFSACDGEGFQIFGESGSIKSGQRVRFRFVKEGNKWLGCPYNNRCDKRTCPGATNSKNAHNFNTCWGETFLIYACGRDKGDFIQNGDLVMIYFLQHPLYSFGSDKRYITIQGSSEGDDASLSICPGINAPTSFSFSLCPNSVFRIHRKP